MGDTSGDAGLYAVSDLHVGFQENREVVERIRPAPAADWLIVAGMVPTGYPREWRLRGGTRGELHRILPVKTEDECSRSCCPTQSWPSRRSATTLPTPTCSPRRSW